MAPGKPPVRATAVLRTSSAGAPPPAAWHELRQRPRPEPRHAPAHRAALQRRPEHPFAGGADLELEILAQMLGDLVDVLLVERGCDHAADLVALRRQRLLL